MFQLNTLYEIVGRHSTERIVDSLPSLKRGGAHVEIHQANVFPRAQLVKDIVNASIDPDLIGRGVYVHLAKCANMMVCGVCPISFLTTRPQTLMLSASSTSKLRITVSFEGSRIISTQSASLLSPKLPLLDLSVVLLALKTNRGSFQRQNEVGKGVCLNRSPSPSRSRASDAFSPDIYRD